jgi:hypothetical protein
MGNLVVAARGARRRFHGWSATRQKNQEAGTSVTGRSIENSERSTSQLPQAASTNGHPMTEMPK